MKLQPLARSSRRPWGRIAVAVALAVGCAIAVTQINGHAQSAGGLTFFKNYFITGDYAVAGVGLRGLGGQNGSPPGIATGTINITGVPARADVVAAFLYWQVVSKSTLGPDSGAIGATFDGKPLFDSTATNAGPYSVVLSQAGTAPCWSSGGGTGSSGGNVLTYTYRADVRRFLTTDQYDRILLNTSHTVQVPDSGSGGNGVPIALGASLVIVYRDPNLSFKSIVLYDGGLTLNNASPTYQVTLKGFYQPASVQTTPPQITYVVGSGQANKNENVYFDGALLAANPFAASDGPSWDTHTYSVPSGPPPNFPAPTMDPQYGAMVNTKIDTAVTGGDCLTPAMIAYKTEVQDTDGDGLLDLWETQSGLLDPNAHPLPNLAAMGANPNVKDLFVEVGAFNNATTTTYGDPNNGGVQRPPHNHMPVAAALTMLGDAYARNGIHAHFDVGDPGAYHALGSDYSTPVGAGDAYLVPHYDLAGNVLARGGEEIDENAALAATCPTSANCEFPLYPGTVGWKVGYKYYRDQLVNSNPPTLNADGSDPCDVEAQWQQYSDLPGGVCERRFDRNRRNMFHYVLAAHFIGLPKSDYACLSNPTDPNSGVPANPDGSCTSPAVPNPAFYVPRTVSGISDYPGGDVMLTLGGFPDVQGRPIGTPLQQAGTLMHEMGHNFDLGHSGIYTYAYPPLPEEPNCNPNYLSVMNYLFQLRGLFSATTTGGPVIDYSSGSLAPINESGLSPITWTAPYLTAWYAPQTSTSWVGSPVTRHCTGTFPTTSEPAMMRVDGPTTGTITWDSSPQDVNFDGTIGSLSAGHADWGALRLNQLASRRNVFGMSVNLGRDGMGRGDSLGRDGMGRDGMGRDGMGRDGMGSNGLGRDGMGRDGMGRDGMGRDANFGDGLGRDGMGLDWAGRDVGELDAEVAAGAGHIDSTPPTITFSASGTAGTGGWYTSAVTLTVTATDPSRVALLSCSPALGTVAGIGTTTASGQATLTTSTAVSCAATDSAGNTTLASSGQLSVKIDSTAPTITITTPASGATYYLNQAVAANYGCADVSGSGIPLTGGCVGTSGTGAPVANGANLDTSTVGSRSLTVKATDNAGNTATKTVNYSVGYKVTLSPPKTPANQGSSVPIIWQEQDGTGAVISDLTTVLELDSVYNGQPSSTGCVASKTGTVQPIYKYPNFSTGKSTLRFVAPNFQFNWDTTSTVTTIAPYYGKGCYTVLIYLNDAPTTPRMTTAVQLK